MTDLNDDFDKQDKWTVRNVSKSSIFKLKEAAFYSELGVGECLDQAVQFWYDQLED